MREDRANAPPESDVDCDDADGEPTGAARPHTFLMRFSGYGAS
jgi:hypothetical protein